MAHKDTLQSDSSLNMIPGQLKVADTYGKVLFSELNTNVHDGSTIFGSHKEAHIRRKLIASHSYH
jgi:hypothetical protein